MIDQLSYHSKLRHINAGEKVAFSMLTLIICILSRSVAAAVPVLAATGILTVYKGKIPVSRYLRLMLVPLTVILPSTLSVIINVSKTPLDLWAFPVGTYYLTVSSASLTFGIRLMATTWASVSCLYFLVLNTPVTDILGVLKKMRCPALLTELMLLIYRFIFILLETAHAIITAQKARLGYKDFQTAATSYGRMCASLFIRAFRRSGALYDAMESRCYDGILHVPAENDPPNIRDILYIMVFELLLLAVIAGGKRI